MENKKSRALSVILATIFLGGLVFLAIFLSYFSWTQIENALAWAPYRCPLKLFTGLECAFCGMTHAWIALLKGEVHRAIGFNFLSPFLLLGAIVFSVGEIFLQSRTRFYFLSRTSAIFFVSVLVLFTILRNLKFFA